MKSSRTLFAFGLFVFFFLWGCAHILQHDKAKDLLKTDEYDQKIIIKAVDAQPPPEVKPLPDKIEAKPAPAEPVSKKGRRKGKVKTQAEEPPKAKLPADEKKVAHLPEIEDSVGFVGRRPVNDPFRVGEKVSLGLSYFKIGAGTLDVEVKPFVIVNNQKAYQFQVSAKSNSFFSRIYSVDDTAITFVSYDDMIPMNLQISIKESKQLAEARTYFDWQNLKASYWQKRITKEHGEQSKKLDWSIQAYSQNVISAAYYLRCFHYEVGKKYAFRVADEGKNIIFKGEVLRKEKLDTDIGELDTIVLRPEVIVDGVFSPVGEILVWITDDDRKFIARLESKIKIGTIVAKIKALEKGSP